MVWVELVYETQWNTFAVVYVVDNLMFNLFEFHGSGSINVCDFSSMPGAQTNCCNMSAYSRLTIVI